MGKSSWGKSSRKGRYFGKKKIVTLVGLISAKCGKISNAKAVRSAVTFVLKRLSQLLGKAVTTVMRWVISDCWKGHLAFISWIWLKMVRSLSRVSCYFGYSSWLIGF